MRGRNALAAGSKSSSDRMPRSFAGVTPAIGCLCSSGVAPDAEREVRIALSL
jgi:hypothetical protein